MPATATPGVEGTPGVEHRVLRGEGGPVSVYIAGDPSHLPVVLLHGSMYDEARFVWDQLFAPLARSFRVYALDLPRHGRSRPWSGSLTHDRLIGILGAAFGELGLKRFSLVGLSMGGGLSIGYAAKHPDEVTRLVLFEPGGLGDRLPHQFVTWSWIHLPGTGRMLNRWLVRRKPASLEKVLRKLFVGGSKPTAPDRLVSVLRDEIDGKAACNENDLDDWQTSAIGPFRLRWNLLEQVSQIQCPTLWLRGADSSLVSQAEMERAASRAHAHAELVVIPGAGHLLPLERPREAERTVIDFLADAGRERR